MGVRCVIRGIFDLARLLLVWRMAVFLRAWGTGVVVGMPGRAEGVSHDSSSSEGGGTMAETSETAARILLMDDEEIILKTTGILLRRLGYAVDFSRDGAEALALYRQALDDGHPYDVVVMDMSIPEGMGGKEAIAHLREMDPGVRAIVTSGYFDDSSTLGELGMGGFSAVIAKPYRIEELGALIQAALRGRE